MKNLSTEIIIKASVEKVWQVLMKHEDYPKWNPFIKHISGESQVGNKLLVKLQIEGKSPMTMKPSVLKNDKFREFRWLGHLFVKGLFDGEHFFILEKISGEETRLIHGENFSGLMVGILMKMIGAKTLAGFEAMNKALKKEAEAAVDIELV